MCNLYNAVLFILRLFFRRTGEKMFNCPERDSGRNEAADQMILQRLTMAALEICWCAAWKFTVCEKCKNWDGGIKKCGHRRGDNWTLSCFPASQIYEIIPLIICIIAEEISVKIAHCFASGKLCSVPGLREQPRAGAFSVRCGSRESAPGCSGWCWWRLPVWSSAVRASPGAAETAGGPGCLSLFIFQWMFHVKLSAAVVQSAV